MSRRTKLLLAPAFVAALVVIGYLLLFRDEGAETVRVERDDLDVTIETVGRLTLRDEVLVRAGVNGQVDQVGVAVGDRVDAGDIIVLLDTQPLERAIAEAERQVERAEFALQAAENAVDRENTPERRLALLDAIASLEAAERALVDTREALTEAAILAPHDGVILTVEVIPGAVVAQAQPVARLRTPNGLQLVADVDELDLPNVRSGTQVIFRADSYPATEIEGEVIDTAPAAEQRGGATVFPTRIRFEAPQQLDLRPGMNADVTIITDERQDVVVLPDRAIRTVGERSFVEVLRNGEREEVEVITGFRAGGLVEIVSGVDEGDRVVVP